VNPQRSAAYIWALKRIEETTVIPAERRSDINYLRAAVMLAHVYAKAGLLERKPRGAPEGQLDLFK
jgi:hypothetical protein